MTGGILGFPIDEQEKVKSSTGAKGIAQRFIQGYVIHWSGGTFSVRQGFNDLYQAIGKWSSVLGLPKSNEIDFQSIKSKKTGVIQFFENGCTQWVSKDWHSFYIYGEVYKLWTEEQNP